MSEKNKPCPLCGKPMEENPKWRGQWSCPDYKIRLNNAPPFEFKCTGSMITDEGVELFNEAFMKIIAEQN